MKIIVKNQGGKSVFTFDVETGTVSNDIPMEDAALEFLRGLETAIICGSQFKDGGTIKDFLIEAGKGENNGDFTIVTGCENLDGQQGGGVTVTNPTPMRKCTECVLGIQTLAYSTGPCQTCHGSQKVPVTSKGKGDAN